MVNDEFYPHSTLFIINSSFGFTELKIGEAKLAGVKGVKRSYRPSWTGLGVKSQ